MTAATLRPDCARCADLCCVAFPFESSTAIAIDKAAGAPCPNLDERGGCGIYEQRSHRGFAGCVNYDCLGAGQRVVQQTFGGQSWRDRPELLQPMLRAFAITLRVHRLLGLLDTLRETHFAERHIGAIQGFEAALELIAVEAAQASSASALAAVEGQVEAFLTSLRSQVAGGRRAVSPA